MIRRAVAVALATIIAINIAGVSLFLTIQIFHQKRLMRDRLISMPREKLEVFVFSRQLFESVKVDRREIKYHGRMYDLAEVRHEGDSVKVWAVADEFEDKLLTLLEETFLGVSESSPKAPSALLKFLSWTFITEQFEFTFQHAVDGHAWRDIYRFSLLENAPLISDPPPRCDG